MNDVQASIEALESKLSAEKARADKAEAACAEMRQVIESFRWADPFAEKSKHAISTDCGKGWVSPEKAKRLREALQQAADTLDEVAPGTFAGKITKAALTETQE